MNKQEFITALANHKTGFIISTGGIDGDRNAPFEINNNYFDSVELTGNDVLRFFNKHNKKAVGGKIVTSAYGMGYGLIAISLLESIKEYFDDCLSFVFELPVERIFEIEIADNCNVSSFYSIGLL